jgi:branched-chain amino acid transport system permease protein
VVLFLQAVVSGLTIGAIYALVAVGYNVVYASTQVFNLAQGMLVMVGVMMTYEFRQRMGWPTLPSIAAAVAISGLINVAVERVCVAPLSRTREGTQDHIALSAFVTTLAASLVIVDAYELIFGPNGVPFRRYFAVRAFDIQGVLITRQQLFMVVAAIVIALGYSVFAKYTRWGLGLSAMAQNREGAALRGVPVAGARIVAFLVAGVISGLAGAVLAPAASGDTTFALNYALKGFVAMAIGGLGSTTGALAGGAVLGLSEAMLTTYGNDEYRIYASLLLLAVIFTLRPRGLLGRKTIRTV